jgi:hypothetical protein
MNEELARKASDGQSQIIVELSHEASGERIKIPLPP